MVFVSADATLAAFNSYYQSFAPTTNAEPDFLALPYSAEDERERLEEQCGVSSLPFVAVLDGRTGAVLCKGAAVRLEVEGWAQQVMDRPEAAAVAAKALVQSWVRLATPPVVSNTERGQSQDITAAATSEAIHHAKRHHVLLRSSWLVLAVVAAVTFVRGAK
jgi:hypothetical protein